MYALTGIDFRQIGHYGDLFKLSAFKTDILKDRVGVLLYLTVIAMHGTTYMHWISLDDHLTISLHTFNAQN